MASPATEYLMPTSKTQTIIDDITSRIRSGELVPGQQLPSAREMRDSYGVSQMTVRIALERLRAARLVVTLQGIGSWVADDATNHLGK
jgi:DNA-binding GntR family transcriptional regulator